MKNCNVVKLFCHAMGRAAMGRGHNSNLSSTGETGSILGMFRFRITPVTFERVPRILI